MIKAYKLKNKTLFGCFYEYSWEKYKANGKPLEKTFLDGWYSVDGELKTLTKVRIEYKNKRYELKNKDLYNEKIPLIIDEHSKEKYESLLEQNLYELVYDEIEIEEPVEFEVIEVDIDLKYDLKTAKEYSFTHCWNSNRRTHYIINLVEFRTFDKCLYPRPLLDLTRPCALTGKKLFIVLSEMIYSKIATITRVKKFDENQFIVNDIENENCLINWEYWSYKSPNNKFDDFMVIANNFGELIEKLESFVKYVEKIIISEKTKKQELINIALDELNQGKNFKEEIEEVKDNEC